MILRFVCKLRGHRWNLQYATCSRCKRTQEDIVEAEITPLEREINTAVIAAYSRGFEEGRAIGLKQGRARAYRLGFMRGGRDVFDRLLKGLRA